MPLKTLQIALVGWYNDAVGIGVRNFPTHKLALVCLPKDAETASRLSADLASTLKVPVDVYTLPGHGVKVMLEVIAQILSREQESFEDIIMNVGGGDKHLACAATTAAFVYGIKAFDVMGDIPEMLPVLKLSYSEVISKAKFDVLEALDKAGGEVESLEDLCKLSGYGKAALSYHLHGAGGESKGLVGLGLAEVEREVRGRSRIWLTTLGKLVLLTRVKPSR